MTHKKDNNNVDEKDEMIINAFKSILKLWYQTHELNNEINKLAIEYDKYHKTERKDMTK